MFVLTKNGSKQPFKSCQVLEHSLRKTTTVASQVILICLVFCNCCLAQNQTTIDFNRDVKPILSNHCFACHGPDETAREAGLRLDINESALAELESGEGKAIVPGNVEQSILVGRIESTESWALMPPAHFGKPLTDSQKSTLKAWIKQGALYEKHWAYRDLVRPPIPEVKGIDTFNPIDAFLLHAMKQDNTRQKTDSNNQTGLVFAPIADHQSLVRRLHLDLTGLPPGFVTEIPNDIANDRQAYAELVERLLQSPSYGERMASYWLDLVRYADTVGYHGDQEHRVTPYRDWVINAFNDNMPFDQFTIEQLAGDFLPNPTTDQLIATGYNRLLQTTHEGGAQDKEYLAKYFSDRVRNVSDVWFGATVACAECHDHKYDPIPQADFYRLGAFFADVKEQGAYNSPNSTPTTRPPEIKVLSPLVKSKLVNLKLKQLAIESSLKTAGHKNHTGSLDRIFAKRWFDLNREVEKIRSSKQWTMITVQAQPRPVRVLHRGDWMDTSGKVVQPGVLSALEQIESDRRLNRLDLANWIVGDSNPLTARVMANRLWYLCFGEGLYRTLEDSGAQGKPPTHPELLDWLSVELIESGWDIKHVLRLIIHSRAYRQSSLSERTAAIDPDNVFFARQNRFRMSAEMIRDQALAVSGLLNRSMGGAAAKPYQPAGYYAHLNFPTRKYKSDRDANQYRRGVYVHWQRQFLHPMLKAFDAPSREECTAKRHESNTPLAALVLLNDPTFVEAARVFAERALQRNSADDERIRWMWRQLLVRDPSSHELSLMKNLLNEQNDYYKAHPNEAKKLIRLGMATPNPELDQAELAAWTFAARALFNLHEAIVRN